MKREIIHTADGSTTIHIPEWNEHYHSTHGALQEAYHVYIKMGYTYFIEKYQPLNISILEMGFGTGLNTLITLLTSQKNILPVDYTSIDAFPILNDELEKLNFTQQLKVSKQLFNQLHTLSWETSHLLKDSFFLTKRKQFFLDIKDDQVFDLIYFDAFGPRVQPELWTEVMFQKMYRALKTQGVLVTYSAKGSVRRAMQAAGFTVERLPGPPGKREMLRATKC